MTMIRDVLCLLAFRREALQRIAERRMRVVSVLWLAMGFLAYVLVRNAVYADLQPAGAAAGGPLTLFWNLRLIEALAFLAGIYLPLLIGISNGLAADGLGFSVSRPEYERHLSGLFPLWGTLLLLTAPIQYLLPEFLVLGVVGISIGLLVLLLLFLVTTTWAVRELDCLPLPPAAGVVILSCLSLPMYYWITVSTPALLLVLALAVAGGWNMVRAHRGMPCPSLAMPQEPGESLDSLRAFLDAHPADAESRYRLALRLRQAGDIDGMRVQLHTILEQARANPRFFRREGRGWILNSRQLLFDSRGGR